MLWELFVVGLLLYGFAFLAMPFLLRKRQQPIAVAPNIGRRFGGPHPRLTTSLHTIRTAPNRRSRTTASGCPNRRMPSTTRLQRRRRP